MWRLFFDQDVERSARRDIVKSQKQLDFERQLSESIAKLSTIAQNLVPGDCVADTRDNEDHTFCGTWFQRMAITRTNIE